MKDNLEEDREKSSFCGMLKKDRNCCNLCIMICAWTFTSFSSYCIGFYIKYFRGSIYVNATIMGFAALLGPLVFVVMLNYMKRTSIFPLLFLITFFGSFGYTITEEYVSLLSILVYYSNYYYFEIRYKTRIYSICNIVSRTFTIMAPLSVELLDNPLLIICIFSLIMVVLSLFSLT